MASTTNRQELIEQVKAKLPENLKNSDNRISDNRISDLIDKYTNKWEDVLLDHNVTDPDLPRKNDWIIDRVVELAPLTNTTGGRNRKQSKKRSTTRRRRRSSKKKSLNKRRK